ncbi:hypothetical protein ACN4EK_04850 [Pantanalinema rosaneae CENA516]|uniref:hypothetical protein n=1 Tax=Pantanalinema rosaneae TaxID=1620701 RepID=UPI003D6F8CCE
MAYQLPLRLIFDREGQLCITSDRATRHCDRFQLATIELKKMPVCLLFLSFL